MDDRRAGRVIRMLRHRRGWRQRDLADRSGVSESAISDMELGRIDRYTLATVRAVLNALDGRAALDVLWGGRGDLDRLLDADHAWLQEEWAKRKTAAGWLVWPEASYNHYGERGRIDSLSFHPPTGILDVSELKTGVFDLQDLIGSVDAKVRIGRRLAADRGWRIQHVVASLVVADGRTARRRIEHHPTLFARFDLRGRAASAWLRRPRGGTSGLLLFVKLPHANQGRLGRAGRRRVRITRPRASVEGMPDPPSDPPERA
ncbi:MAG: helix-turn-helix domain-containing protein [Candidatus Limnocylindria bacterium]